MKQVTKITTDKDSLLFIGIANEEEYYQEIGKTGGWSFMGLRPNTEKELREYARDIDISEYCEIPDFLDSYIDHDKFAEDMEDDWENNHDVQATREDEQGETLYLGFGSGQDANGYFKSNNITDYKSYCQHFDVIGLTKKEFTEFVKEYKRS